MNNKKAQGLPLNLIILAIIAALVLVIILAFTIGGAGSIFSKIFKTGSTSIGDDLDTVRTKCQGLCDQASLLDANAQKTSNFCMSKFNVDLDGDRVIGCPQDDKGVFDPDCASDKTKNTAGQSEKGITCGSTDVGVTCSFTCPKAI